MLEFQNVHFTYPGASEEALRGLTLRIPPGRKTAICGHNGSGKSTLFLLALGMYKPSTGTVRWQGAELSYRAADLAGLRREIGLVFQDPEQQIILHTPEDDISYGLRNAGLPEAEIRERTEAIIGQMGLEPLARRPVHQLSLGQKKRVSLAGVLVLEPQLLVLDEPTAYLDRKSDRRLLEELDRIHGRGVTIAMATHDMNTAYAWADWMIVLHEGRCVLEGTPEQVFADETRIEALDLELPLLLELWRALPPALREGESAPKSVAQWKALLASAGLAKDGRG